MIRQCFVTSSLFVKKVMEIGTILINAAHNRVLWLIILLVCWDFLTGGSKAIVLEEVNSSVGLKGVVKHVNVLIVAYIMCIFKTVVLDEITNGAVNVMLLFLAYNYVISIIENISQLGIPVPKSIKNKLERIKEELDEKE